MTEHDKKKLIIWLQEGILCSEEYGFKGNVLAAMEVALESLTSENGWVKCVEQMPSDDTLCLGVDDEGVIWTMYYDCGIFTADTGDVEGLKITHWKPLPTPPEE